MKRCTGPCGEMKPFSEFHKRKQSRDGLQYRCKRCQVECNAASLKKRTAKDPSIIRTHNLWSHYRLRPADYDARLASQGGVCAIGGEQPPEGVRTLEVDHDHSHCSGEVTCGSCVRGLLCHACNTSLRHYEESGKGRFGSDPDLQLTAIRYLERASRAIAS